MLIPIVDTKDRIIGYKNREKITPADIYRVSALWLFNDKDEFLLAQRAFTKKHDPGKFGPAAAGTVEKGETYLQNIIKEVREELGIANLKLKKGPKIERKASWHFFGQWYIGRVSGRPNLKFQKEEVAQLRWIDYKTFNREYSSHPEKFLKSLKENADMFRPYLKQ